MSGPVDPTGVWEDTWPQELCGGAVTTREPWCSECLLKEFLRTYIYRVVSAWERELQDHVGRIPADLHGPTVPAAIIPCEYLPQTLILVLREQFLWLDPTRISSIFVSFNCGRENSLLYIAWSAVTSRCGTCYVAVLDLNRFCCVPCCERTM